MPMPFARPLRGSVLNCLCLLLMLIVDLSSLGAKAASPSYAAENEYQKAADACYRLEQNPGLGRRREDWLTVVQDLELVCQKHPGSQTAPSCLHLSGRLRRSMYQRFSQDGDLKRALFLFGKVVSAFPQSPESADSLYAIGQIEQARGNLRTAAKVYADVVSLYPFSARKTQAEGQLQNLTAIAESLSAKKRQAAAPVVPRTAALKPAQSRPQLSLSAEKPAAMPPPMVVTRVPVQPFVQEKKSAALPAPQPVTAKPVQEKTAPPTIAVSALKIAELGRRKAAVQAPKTASPEPVRAKITLPEPKSVQAEGKAGQEKTAAAEPVKERSAASAGMRSDLKTVIFGETEQEKAAAPPAPKTALPEPVQVKSVQKSAAASSADKDEKISAAEPKKEGAAPTTALLALKTEQAAAAPVPKITLPEPVRVKPVQAKIVLPETKPAASVKPEEPEKTAAKIVLSDLKIADIGKAEPEPPATPQVAVTKEETQNKPELVSILPVQHWSSDKYSRVAVTASGPAVYHAELPGQDSGRPGRVSIEFQQSRIATEARAPIAVKNGLIREIRADQTDPATVRVVLELEAGADCKVFSLSDPFRVVVDLRKPEETAAVSSAVKAASAEKSGSEPAAAKKSEPPVKPADLTLAQQLGLGVRRIVIDPGHGGKDSGAAGFGLQEKDIVLKVAEKVRTILKKEHDYNVFLTRESDTFLPLEERTAIANTKGADMFLSIHVNAHPKDSVKGVETFYLNLATNPEAMRVAALENATSTHSISEMQDILADLLKNTKINESSQLAEFIQKSMISGLGKRYQVKDLGVKQAPFYVLIGAQMPAALAEISFLTNPKEAELLKDEQYLQAIAEQITAGVISYIEHRRTAALIRPLVLGQGDDVPRRLHPKAD